MDEMVARAELDKDKIARNFMFDLMGITNLFFVIMN